MGEKDSNPTWHFSRGGKQYGPISDRELLKLTELGKLQPDDLLWRPGFAAWQTAKTIPGLLMAPTSAPAQPLSPATSPGVRYQPDRRQIPPARSASGNHGSIGTGLYIVALIFALPWLFKGDRALEASALMVAGTIGDIRLGKK